MIIFANLQLEAETCDDFGGARFETGKGGASGTVLIIYMIIN